MRASPHRSILPILLVLAALLPAGIARAAAERPLAVVGFNFVDTSGEAKDQSAAHAARLSAMMETLQSKLAASGRFKIIALACTPEPCTAEPDVDGALILRADHERRVELGIPQLDSGLVCHECLRSGESRHYRAKRRVAQCAKVE